MLGNRLFRTMAVCLALLPVVPAAAQGTKADYERAGALRQRFDGLVSRDRVTPQWLKDGRLTYRVNTPGGKIETWLVDLKSGKKSPFAQEPNAAQESLRPRSPATLKSGENGEETEIVFDNQTKGTVRVYWVDGSGGRKEYGTIAAGGSRPQHTFAGHAWLVTDAEGKALVGFVAESTAGRAVITGEVPPPPRAGGGGRPRSTEARDGQSPDGKWTAFRKDHNLWIREKTSGKETPLTTDGTADKFLDGPLQWSPDSRRLVAFRTVPAQEHKVHIVESAPRDQLQPKLLTLDYLKPGDRIRVSKPCLFDPAKGAEIPVSDALFPNPWSITDLRWQPDSKRFQFLYNQRGHQVLRIVGVDAETGAAQTLIDEQSKTFIDYAGKFYSRYLEGSDEQLWMSERDGWNHLYLYDTQSGRLKNQVTSGQWVVRGVDRVDPEKRQIWFRAGGIYPEQDPYYVHFCRINFDGSGLVRLTAGDGNHTVQYSPNGEYLIDSYSRVDMPTVTELRRVTDGSLVSELERGDVSTLTAAGWKAPQRFATKGRDGSTDIYGVIYFPANLNPTLKYPVVEDIYAGPQGSFVPKTFQVTPSQQILAELGFIVVKIDGMGTSHRSKAFHDVCWKNLGDAGFPDRIQWMRAAAQKHPYMDLERVGIFGGSAGGQNALRALLAHPTFYKVAVSGCGCHDNRMDKIWWNELWMGWPVGPHYDEQSNVTQAHKLQGKLLLIVGELDTNVDPASTMQVVDRLVKADKDFDLLVVPGAGHGMGGTYGHRRLQDFFVRHLHGADPRRP